MNILYDPHTDTLTLSFSTAPIIESDEEKPGVILDYGADGSIIEMKILNASRRVNNPQEMNFRVAAESASA